MFLPLLLALSLLGCMPSDTEGGTVGGGDGGAEGDGGTLEECDHDWKGTLADCSPFSPFNQTGTSWTYTSTKNDYDSLVRTAVTVGEYGGATAWQIEEHQETAGDDSLLVEYRTRWVRCDDKGVWMLGGTDLLEDWYADSRKPMSSTTEVHYTCPDLLVPVALDEDTTWTSEYSYTWDRDDGERGTRSGTREYIVLDLEDVDVPAGAYSAWSVWEDSRVEHWLVDGVGTVKDGELELASIEEP